MKSPTVGFAIWMAMIPYLAFAQAEKLQAGPMVGYSTMQEAGVWVQTDRPADVSIRYWSENDSTHLYQSSVISTNAAQAYTAHLIADSLQPGHRYRYLLYIDNIEIERPYKLSFTSQPLWQYRNDAPDFSFALGSCMYINQPEYDRPGKPYGRGYHIFNSILEKQPHFMLWLGDNVYLREADWNSRAGIYGRYTHDRSISELQPLLGSVHHYAIWDDHDYGPNNSDRSFWNKEITAEAFRRFWYNPNYGQSGGNDISGTFFWNDVQFFLLDDRWYRAPNSMEDKNKPLLGQNQMRWLKDALLFSQAPFKIIVMGGQVINPAQDGENYASYPSERQQLLDFIKEENIPGILFLSGDRHFTELSMLQHDSYPLYDLTVSPLTSGVVSPDEEQNTCRVKGTLISQQNFAVVQVSGRKGDRSLNITVYDDEGSTLWQKTINQNLLNKNETEGG
ncbi:alkaline phosphatase [Roseivirga sp. BDSF3-8]|uniref:alkaline phosphatase D family protein n=1 Tax=Roseivirga sp. BDSF3-8 TaxID=3241598 RepID=UPI00353191E9